MEPHANPLLRLGSHDLAGGASQGRDRSPPGRDAATLAQDYGPAMVGRPRKEQMMSDLASPYSISPQRGTLRAPAFGLAVVFPGRWLASASGVDSSGLRGARRSVAVVVALARAAPGAEECADAQGPHPRRTRRCAGACLRRCLGASPSSHESVGASHMPTVDGLWILAFVVGLGGEESPSTWRSSRTTQTSEILVRIRP